MKKQRDRIVFMAEMALLIALNYMVINTVVDILYGIIDPRVRCS